MSKTLVGLFTLSLLANAGTITNTGFLWTGGGFISSWVWTGGPDAPAVTVGDASTWWVITVTGNGTDFEGLVTHRAHQLYSPITVTNSFSYANVYGTTNTNINYRALPHPGWQTPNEWDLIYASWTSDGQGQTSINLNGYHIPEPATVRLFGGGIVVLLMLTYAHRMKSSHVDRAG